MHVELFEAPALSPERSDLEVLTERAIAALVAQGARVSRYDRFSAAAGFARVEGLALPVLVVDGEVLSAGTLDFTLIDTGKLRSGCGGCGNTACDKKACGGCGKYAEK